VQQNEIDQILSSAKATLDHPLLYPRIFALAARRRREKRAALGDIISQIVTEEYEEFSRRLDRSQVQESVSARNVFRTRQLAKLLIDDKGEVNLEILPQIIRYFKEHLYSLGPQRQYDGRRQEHILKVLELLNADKNYSRTIKMFSTPISNKNAEEFIRQTLQLPPNVSVTDVHTRQAVLAAWLCFLRQNVGSCFATAPAEIVHDEQPDLFLLDLMNIITTGTLKRTFAGIEYSVPLSASWGAGDLKKPIVFTISSKGITPEIWYSPGLITAFEAMGLLKPQEALNQKIQLIENWIKPILQQHQHKTFCILTAEEIIRKVLLQSLGLTERQIADYESRPRPMVHSQLMIQSFKPRQSNGGVGDRCANFYYQFELGKNVFKSLADNALLKAWEFTLASFSDIKSDFAKWNFYSSLGLQSNDPNGIGQCIYQNIQGKVDQANRKAQEIQYEYETVYTQVKTLESRMRTASTEKELQWLKIDYQNRKHEFYFLEEQRDDAQNYAKTLVNLYDTLHKLYSDLFVSYFQEVYDAELHDVTTGPYDDSPAGFRLLYKHGRSNTSQWTLIKNHQEFIDSLASFFIATESEILHAMQDKKIERDLSEVITAIINHIKTREFIESSFHRMATAHNAPMIKDPLNNLERIQKKPWVYTSGGTMNTLLSGYYKLESPPLESEKWVENEMELMVFLVETMKQIPVQLLNQFLKNNRQSILMQSPTHAFLLKPMTSLFRDAWSNEEFTYTFLRDRFLRPLEIFVEGLLLDDEMIKYLLKQIGEKLPENYLPRFKALFGHMHGPLNPIFFRESLVEMFEQDRGLRLGSRSIIPSEDIDSMLYSLLPFCSINDLRSRVEKIFHYLSKSIPINPENLLKIYNQIPLSRGGNQIISAQQLQDICKALLCLSEASTTTSYDFHFWVSHAAQQLGFAMPAPVIFGDTNWVKDMFAFTVNPGTGKLELWRMDYTGSKGYPMASWKQWLDGSRQDRKWSVYVKPYEYGQT